MEVLKNLSATGLDALRHNFALHDLQGGLAEEEFVNLVARVYADHNIPTLHTDAQFRKLFAKIDVLGQGRISWDAFSMYAIESTRQKLYGVATTRQEDVSFRPFHLEQLLPNSHTLQVTEVRVLRAIGKVMKVITDSGGRSTMELCDIVQNLPSFGVIRPDPSPLLAWDLVPHTVGEPYSNSIVCSYNGGFIRWFGIKKASRYVRSLEECKYMRIPESQSSLQWMAPLNRLVMGSRTGQVTLWDMRQQVMASRKRLFQETITAMRGHGHLLYAASLEAHQSIKCLDLERNIVRFALDDHSAGGVMVLETDEQFLFSAGLEQSIVQRPLVLPRSPPMHLYDTSLPHKGRVTALRRLEGAPFLVSGDTHGIVKFWDLRMGSCLQTFKGSNFSSTARGDELPELEDGVSGYLSAPIHSICHIEALGKLTVSTTRELLVLTADMGTRPDLVDDHHSCRFVFYPNPDYLLTVHDNCAKLWSSTTGMLSASSDPNMTKYDITTCCIVEPLNRQLLVGTMGGEVKAFSVVMLNPTVDLTPTLRNYVRNTEIASLHVVMRYRNAGTPCVFVVSQFSVFLVPFKPECSPEEVFQFAGLLKGFMQPTEAIKATAITEDHLLVATSHARVYVVSFQDTVALSHTFCMSTVVEAIIARPAIMLGKSHGKEPTSDFLSSSMLIFADVAGRLHVAALRRDLPRRGGGGVSPLRCEVLGSWLPRRPDSWARTQAPRRQSSGRRRSQGRGRPSVDFYHRSNYPHKRQRMLSHRQKCEASRNEAGKFSLDAVSSTAVILVYLEQYDVLVTADEEGMVGLWDMTSAVAQCTNVIYGAGPVLISSWRVPQREIIFFGAASHPTLQLPVMLTATGDLQASLWSADGVPLGSLATGREVDEASGRRRFGLRPYLLMSDSTTPELWTKFVTYMERRGAQDMLPTCTRGRRQHTHAPRTWLQTKDADEDAAAVAAVNEHIFSSTMSGTLSSLPLLAFATDPGPIPKSSFARRVGVSNDNGTENVQAESQEYGEKEDGTEEAEQDAVEENGGGDGMGTGALIVQPRHRRHVTRAAAPFSLWRTGLVRLPPLTAAKRRCVT